MIMWKLLAGIIIYLTHCGETSILEQDGSVVILLHHSLTDNQDPLFTPRGNITIQSLRLGQAIVNQDPLTTDQQKQLRDLAAKNQLYFLKATVMAHDGTINTFRSTLKACMLAESELDDRISVSLDYTGKVIGVTGVIASTSACEGAIVPLNKLKFFMTSVYVRQPELGPIPDTASYIQKLEKEREARERGEVKDNRSFFAKYWMYIIPFVVLMVISSAANPEAAAGGSSGGGGR